MSVKNLIVITLEDTKEVLTFGDGEEHQDIYKVMLKTQRLQPDGKPVSYSESSQTTIHVRRKTLVDAGCKNMYPKEGEPQPTETVEDLLLRLLEHVGIYSQEQ